MIWPYYTVLVDSFREAFASRVLWILLALATLLLVAFAPIHLGERKATDITLMNPSEWGALLARMKRQSQRDEPSPGKHLWTVGSDEFRTTTEVFLANRGERRNQFERMFQSTAAFNKLLASEKFYDADAFANVVLDSQTHEELASEYPTLTGDARKHFNRRLLKAAFPTETVQIPLEQAEISYLAYNWPLPGIMSVEAVQELVNTYVLPIVMNALVGIFGVFAAILVTAPIIPKTFEAGAIDLLLSKPVSRTILFLVKFFGGCAYILLISTYFIAGAWLILGTRLGIWNEALWICIPVFSFMFIINYSVSALSAVIWRNAIVSVVVTILFWTGCLTVGATKVFVEGLLLDGVEIRKITPTEDGVLTLNGSDQFSLWGDGQWRPAFPLVKSRGWGTGEAPLYGPVYQTKQQRLAYVVRPLSALSRPSPLVTSQWVSNDWETNSAITSPVGTTGIFDAPNGEIIAFGRRGPEKLGSGGFRVFGFNMPVGGKDFEPLLKEDGIVFDEGNQSAMNADSGDIVVATEEQVMLLMRQADGTYLTGKSTEIKEFVPDQAAFVNDTIAIAESSGSVIFLNARSLQQTKAFKPGGSRRPKSIIGHGGQFGVLYDDGYLVVVNEQGETLCNFGGGNLAAAFDNNGNLFVADRVDRVILYKAATLEELDRWSPTEDVLRLAYRYVLIPVYTAFPKPAALVFTVGELLQRNRDEPVDLFGQIWSNLAFVIILLTITCVYLHRLDI